MWRLYATLLTTLAMLLLVSASASHLHKTALATEECALCCTIVDKIADMSVPPAIVQASVQLLPYRLLALAPQATIHVFPPILPPSCGPPCTSA